jgi:hypothetical protein
MQDTTVEVAHIGGSVRVRPIPPKLQGAIAAKATKRGKVDFQELMVGKLVYGLEDPSLTEVEARRITQRLTRRVLGPIVDRIDRLSGTDEHLRGTDHPYAVRKFNEPVMMATAWLGRFPDVVRSDSRSREAHGAKTVRRRGSRRTSSPTRAGPDEPDPEPPAARPCACGCGRPRQAGKGRNYFDDACRKRHARERKRKQRARDREQPERVAERTAAPTGRVRCGGRCGQAAYEFDHQWICRACGRPIAGAYSEVNGHLAAREVLEVLAEEARRGGRVPWVTRQWKTRPPKRHQSMELRRRDREAGLRFDKPRRKPAS